MPRLEKFRMALSALGADAALITDEINESWLCSFDFTDGFLLITRDSALLLTDSRFIEAAKAKADGAFTCLEMGKPRGDFFAKLFDRYAIKNLAFEDTKMTVAALNAWENTHKTVHFMPMGAALDALRRTKDNTEISAIKRAQAITDAAFSHMLKTLTPSMTEIDAAVEIEFFMRRAGATGVSFPLICVSGEASSLPHGVPRNVKLRPGFFTMDTGCMVDGYCSDMTRTVVLGRADEEMKKLYETVKAAQAAGIEKAKPGALCEDVDAAARTLIDNAGYAGRFGHGLGHGVGRHIHEAPVLNPSAGEDRLTAGDIVTVEPGIYIEGKYGCRIEDMVVIGEHGSEDITASTHELIELF